MVLTAPLGSINPAGRISKSWPTKQFVVINKNISLLKYRIQLKFMQSHFCKLEKAQIICRFISQRISLTNSFVLIFLKIVFCSVFCFFKILFTTQMSTAPKSTIFLRIKCICCNRFAYLSDLRNTQIGVRFANY